MKTFKCILLVTALFIGINASAQLNPISLGIKGGVNLSNWAGDMDGTKSKVGFNAGLTLDISLPANLYIGSGLEFTTKGFNDIEIFKSGGAKAILEGSANAMYLQVPVHLGYKVSVAPGTKIVFHAGPYFAYGIGGKTKFDKVTFKADGTSVSFGIEEFIQMAIDEGMSLEDFGDIEIGDASKKYDTFGSDGLKKFDWGIGLGAGVEIWKFTAGVGYDFGLADVGREGVKVNNRNAYLSVGIKF